MARVAVAMSGGVDSSTAAAMLREDGHEVVGVTLQLWDYTAENLTSGRGRCCSPTDIADARIVSDQLNIPHYVFDHSEAFEDHIVEPFVQEYKNGMTPSPCINCNRLVKFDILLKLAQGLEADFLATGHYARLEASPSRPQLHKGLDHSKDQSYFLFDVPVERFEKVIFPLGGLAKGEVRATARRLNLAVADKPESYELCFIPDGNKDNFVEGRLPIAQRRNGPVRHLDGTLLGQHSGLHRFTVGQRRGLGLTSAEPLFVVALERGTDTLIVGPSEALAAKTLDAVRCNWVSIEAPTKPVRAHARIRHRHNEVDALITPVGDDRVRVQFKEAQRAITPGQGVAFYDGDLLLGGGWIEGT